MPPALKTDAFEMIVEKKTASLSASFRRPRSILTRLPAIFLSTGLGCASFGSDPDKVARPQADQITALIRQLGDPSYEVRTQAMRSLCTIGPAVADALKTAARGDDAEIVLRAKKILQAFESLLFSGTHITLEASATAIEWDQPLDVSVKITNTSSYPARLPFEQGAVASDAGDAAQVANMVDISEWLQITSPKESAVELRVDDISEDPAILRVIESRLGNGPLMNLPPGESIAVRGRSFNRGWARYPLLDEGAYVIQFEYVPPWQDAALAAAEVGKVTSEPIIVKVTRGAPDTISREGAEADLVVEQVGAEIEARLINRTDRLVRINANLGSAAPFAEGRWIVESGSLRTDLPVQQGTIWQDFLASRIQEVAAGQSIVLVRESRQKLLQAAAESRPPMAELTSFNVGFAYANLADRQWQVRQGQGFAEDAAVPEVLRKPLPLRILATRQTSNSILLHR